jgi:hypothetical protein
MERVAQARSATITQTLSVDGTPTDATGTPTIAITRADGTVLLAETSTGVTHPDIGQYAYTLTPAQTALLDSLAVRWTATLGGQPQTFTDTVEVAGGFAFSIAQARAVRPLDNATTYTTARIVEMRTLVEDALERELGYALVPRYSLDWLDYFAGGSAWGEIPLRPYTTAVRTLTIDGVAATGMTLRRPGTVTPTLRYTTGFARWSDALVGIEHGQPVTEAEATQAALTLAKTWLVSGPVDDRTTALATEDGTFTLSTPGRGGSIFGVPQVDSFVQRASLRAGVA